MYTYQVGLLGGRQKLQSALAANLQSQFKELGLERSWLSVLRGADAILARDRKAPFVLVFFGYHGCGSEHDEVLDNVIEDSVPTFPVVAHLDQYRRQVPAALHEVNGLQVAGRADLPRVSSFILEAFRLLRKTRRLFISYRRAETASIAIQLYEELDARNFDVFLDTHSIAPGEPVQEVLWHRLADTDVVVLLESPEFHRSQWTMEELARANLTNVQVLQLVWPQLGFRAEAHFSEFFPLDTKAFRRSSTITGPGARLKSRVVRDVCSRVESLRARAIAARYAYLVDQFCDLARWSGFDVTVQQGRAIEVEYPSGRLVAIPAVGIPDAVLNQEVEAVVASEHPAADSVWIVYDERGVRQLWQEHLAWLNGYARVRCVQIASAPALLEALR